jgi:hypothetical protein
MDGASVTGDETGIHVFVMLPLDILNEQHKIQYGENPTDEVSSESELTNHLKTLQINGVKGVMVDCWWGRVEAAGPGRYKWDGYEKLFSIVRAAQLKLHVVMSFHACLEDGVETIPLPDWVKRIGNQKGLFYNDARDDPCTEYLSWAVDDKDVLEDDSSNQFSPLQVYENFMSKFKENMVKYLPGTITMIEVGLGPSGELRYPAYRSAWNIGPPAGIGAFQVSGILLCKSSATCNQCNLPERNHLEQDSYAQEDLCSVLIVGMHLLSMRVQLDHKSVAAVATLSLLLVFCTRFMGKATNGCIPWHSVVCSVWVNVMNVLYPVSSRGMSNNVILH